MDVPARQAYVAALVDPAERTAAAGYTNAARHLVRPAGPALASLSMGMAAGLPFLIAGGLKAVYDVALYLTFRRVRLAEDDPLPLARGWRASRQSFRLEEDLPVDPRQLGSTFSPKVEMNAAWSRPTLWR